MAAGAFIFPDKAKLNFFSATGLLQANTANFRLALIASTWTPANSTDEVTADLTGEIANGNGYTNIAGGGNALSGVVLNQTAGTVKFTASAIVLTASGTGIPAWRRGVVYYNGTLNGKVNPIVGHFLGDSTPADIALTTSGNTLTITPNASGIMAAT